jgi:hypothetical protein
MAVLRSLAVLCSLLLLFAAGCSGGSNSDTGTSGAAVSDATTSVSGAPTERYVSQADFGEAWPLTVPGGMLRCEGPGAVSFETDEGIVHAVNRTAKEWSRTNNLAWKDIEAIRAPVPSAAGRMLALAPLIDDGLILCNEN